MVYEVDRIACRGLVPDLTLVIDIDTETGLERAHRRNQHDAGRRNAASTSRTIGFHRKVREAYRQLAADEPNRVRLIDGGRPETAVAADVWAAVEPLLRRTALRAAARSRVTTAIPERHCG